MIKPDTADEWKTEAWGQHTREEIVLHHAPLVKYIAGRLAMKLPASVDQDDLFQAGILGLIDAITKFEPERGLKFRTYAEFRIRGAMLDELRAMDWVPRAVRQLSTQLEDAMHTLEQQFGRPAEDVEIAKHLGMTLEDYFEQLEESRNISILSFEDLHTIDDENNERDLLEILADPNVEDPIETIGLHEMRFALANAINVLPAKEKLVITLYYYEELTMGEIGVVMGLTESRISQLHSKAALRMRARMRRFLQPGGKR